MKVNFPTSKQRLKMDDDIDIEEHDILEHPQVKAAFPHLAKIEIQDHTLGASFLDETQQEEDFENLLQERPGFEGIEEDGDSTCAYQQTELIEEHLEGRLQNGECEKEDYNDIHIISDSESTADPANVSQAMDELVAVEQADKLTNAVKQTDHVTHKKSANENTNDQEIDSGLIENDLVKSTATGNILEISDDESERSDKIEQEAPRETNGIYLENLINKIVEDAINFKFIDEVPKIYNIIEEGPRVEEIDHQGPTIDDVSEESTITNEIIEEGPIIDEQGTISDKFLEVATEHDSLINKASENNSPEDELSSKDKDEQNHTKDQIYSETDGQYEAVKIKEEFDYSLDRSIDTYDDELPPEDIFHHKNMIILGSRPSSKPSLDIPCKLSLIPVVLLEDLEVLLNDSNCYCQECKTLFATPNALDSHRMIAHSLLAPISNRAVKSTAQANIARKSTSINKSEISSSTYCNHCSVTFKDNTSLIKHLYELLPGAQYKCSDCDRTFRTHSNLAKHNLIHVKKEPRRILKAKVVEANPILRDLLIKDETPKAVKRSYPKPAKPPPANINSELTSFKNETYKCKVCNAIFDTHSRARTHRNMHHSEYKAKTIICKLKAETSPSKTLAFEEDECVSKKVKKDNNECKTTIVNKLTELVPKAALFQCQRCKLHFMTSGGALIHFLRNQTCTNKPGVLWSCQICKKKLLKKDANRHKIQHKISSNIKIYKVTRNTNERTLCRCTKCRVHFEYRNLRFHYDKCGKLPTVKCHKCNIVLHKISSALHEKKHNNEKLTQKDFIYVDYVEVNGKHETQQVIRKIKVEPELKSKIVNKQTFENNKHKLYYCKHCKCCLFSRAEQSKKSHLTKRCLQRFAGKCYNCDKCGLRISRDSRESHEKMHSDKSFTLKDGEFFDFATLKRIVPPIPKYPCCKKCKIHFLNRKLLKKHICGEDYDNCNVCGMMFECTLLDIHTSFHEAAVKKSNPSSPKILPALMMKYESLNAIWNILFSCGKCEMVSDMYNRAVEHSQSHLRKERLPKTIKCYICDFKFDESSWSKHSALHSRMNVHSKSFKILKYEPKRLLDESWFQMFESLPEKEIRQILDRSIFGNERSLKMRLVKDGLPEFTIYCCSICRVSYDNASILNHVHSKCKRLSHLCKTCDIAFHDANALQFHLLLHKKGVKAEEFRIIQFVKIDKGTKPKPTKLGKATMKVTKAGTTILGRKLVKGGKNKSRYVLYKCRNCLACVHNKSKLNQHMCMDKGCHWFCEICKVNFMTRNKSYHIKLHENIPDISATNIRIVCFGEAGVSTTSRSRKANSSKKKSKIVAPNTDAEDCSLSSRSTEKPKPRNTFNSSKSSVNISYESDSDVQEKRTAKLYKCDCGLHFTSARTVDGHMKKCGKDFGISKENCSKCGLLFPSDVLVDHLCKHHSQETQIIVEEVHKKQQDNHIKLYKCSDCDVYFLNQNSCYKHISKHEPLDAKEFIECKMCCLQFRILSLHVHMKKHHGTKFDLDQVLVEEYHPSVGKQAPKIEIYLASDRVVSSSNGND